MKISSVELIVSAVRISQYPTMVKPEFLLVGRSNIGKSSFVNTIIKRKNYAHTSSRPGRTQTLNFYLINNDFYLVDVPGYGYTSMGKKHQKKIGLMIEEYLANRSQLKEVFLLIDFRHKPTKDDLMMYNFLKYHEKKVTVIATKVDKVAPTHREKQQKIIIDTLDLVMGDELVFFSNVTKKGVKEIYTRIAKYLDFIELD